ncbi:hypothetical protein V8E36_007956 [Tilletia maclaganii]
MPPILVPPSEQERRAQVAAEEAEQYIDGNEERGEEFYDDDIMYKYPDPDSFEHVSVGRMGQVTRLLVLLTGDSNPQFPFASRVSDFDELLLWIQKFVKILEASPDYITAKKKKKKKKNVNDTLAAGVRVENGRLSRKNESNIGFNNSKTGNAMPAKWQAPKTRPTTIDTEDTKARNPDFKKKIVREDDLKYAVFCNFRTQYPRQHAMWFSPYAATAKSEKDLREGVNAIVTFLKNHYATQLSRKDWNWSTPTLGGEFFPRVERPLLIKGGEVPDGLTFTCARSPASLARGSMTTKAIGEDIDFQYNAVPEVTVLDTEDRDKWTVDWHHAHLLPENGLWEVGLFFRAYVSEGTKKVGFGWVLESLVLHGRQRAEKVTSSLPVNRTKNHFAAYGDMEQERAKRRRRRAARKGNEEPAEEEGIQHAYICEKE